MSLKLLLFLLSLLVLPSKVVTCEDCRMYIRQYICQIQFVESILGVNMQWWIRICKGEQLMLELGVWIECNTFVVR